jgi:hypothetical protein
MRRKFILWKSLANVFEAAAVDFQDLIGPDDHARIGFNDATARNRLHLHHVPFHRAHAALHRTERNGGAPLKVHQFFQVFFQCVHGQTFCKTTANRPFPVLLPVSRFSISFATRKKWQPCRSTS